MSKYYYICTEGCQVKLRADECEEKKGGFLYIKGEHEHERKIDEKKIPQRFIAAIHDFAKQVSTTTTIC